MHLPSVQDFINLIRQVGHDSLLYCCNVEMVYLQLPLGPRDWPLVCLRVDGCYFNSVSLPVSLRWVAAAYFSGHHSPIIRGLAAKAFTYPATLMILVAWLDPTNKHSNTSLSCMPHLSVWGSRRCFIRQSPPPPSILICLHYDMVRASRSTLGI